MRVKALFAAFILLVVATVTMPAQNQAAPPAPLTSEQLVALTDDVAKEVEALRGWTFKQPVKKELTTVAEMRRYLEQQADKEMGAPRMLVVQAFLRTIGLLPPTADLKATWLTVLESQVGGYYVPATKTMHLVARDGLPPFVQKVMLAHELTHALDDEYIDLETITKSGVSTEDHDLTAESVVEGSATALMMQYAAKAMMNGRVDLNALKQYSEEEADRDKVFFNAPRYFSAMLGSYVCGMQFLARGQVMAMLVAPDDRKIGEALMAARKDLPQSTEQILHPEKYWDPARRDDPVVIDDAAAARWLAQPGWSIVHRDTVGEMLTAILTSRGGAIKLDPATFESSNAWTNAAAAGWGGDRFYLLAGTGGDGTSGGLKDLKGVWVTAWDTTKDRDEFLAALPNGSLAPGAVADAVGDGVAVVYFGIDDKERTSLTSRLRESPLPMTKDGKPWSVTR